MECVMHGAQVRGRSPSGTLPLAGGRGPGGAPADPGGFGGVEEERPGRRVRTGEASGSENDPGGGSAGMIDPVDEALPGRPRVTGRRLRELLADDAWLDELIDRSQEGGVALTGEGRFLPEMIKAVLERGL